MGVHRTVSRVIAAVAVLMALAATPALAADDVDATPDTSETGTPEAPAEEAPATVEEAPPPAGEEPVPFDPTDPEQIHRTIVFPVVGPASYWQDFGACRDGCARSHEGTDIATGGWKGVPVVAAHDGTVVWARVGGELAGCGLIIEASDGWRTVYTHLNTDLPGTDVPEAPCFAPGIEEGAQVRAGTLVGWVGDAGNAEGTSPHLHFEIRNPDGIAVDPWVSLTSAHRIDHRWIDAADLVTVATQLFGGPVPAAYVIDESVVDRLAVDASYAVPLGIPLVPFDPADPTPARHALAELAPERIIVLSGTAPEVVDALRNLAPIVETADVSAILPPPPEDLAIPTAPAPSEDPAPIEPSAEDTPTEDTPTQDTPTQDTPTEDAPSTDTTEDAEVEEPPIVFDVVPDRHATVLAGGVEGASWNTDPAGAHPVLIVTWGWPPEDIGASGTAPPHDEANPNGLWWRTADGWRRTETLDEAPAPGMTYVVRSQAHAWTVAYVSSTARAPQMPLWHHQPVSLPSTSL